MILKDKNLYYVGGVVRDEILGQSSFDIDFCYEGNAIEFSKDFNIIKTNSDFGTVRIHLDNNEIDIASTRCETYPQKGHLPKVEKIGCSLKEDLLRRDFTINAMAKNTLTNEVVDYFDGMEDIKNKKLRVLHSESFIDDPSRIIRGLKFSIRFNFDLEENTQRLQMEYLNNINYDMSYHRIKKELKETFNLNKYSAYEKFINEGIYKLLGEGQVPKKINPMISTLIERFCPKNIWLIYIGFFDLSNFELTLEEKTIIENYKKIFQIIPKTDYETYKLFENLSIETIIMYAVSTDLNIALNYLENLAKIRIEVCGEDLKQLGITQGKIYKEIFEYVLSKKIQNPKINKEDEINLIRNKFL